jgi:hypothetical protein
MLTFSISLVVVGLFLFLISGVLWIFKRKPGLKLAAGIGCCLFFGGIVIGAITSSPKEKPQAVISVDAQPQNAGLVQKEFKELSAKFRRTHDKFEGNDWYTPKSLPDVPPQGTSTLLCYVGKGGRLFFESFYSDLGPFPTLAHSSVNVLIGDEKLKTSQVLLIDKNVTRNSFGESVTYPEADSYIAKKIGMSNGKPVIFRLNGLNTYHEGSLNQVQIKAFEDCGKLSELISSAEASGIKLDYAKK